MAIKPNYYEVSYLLAPTLPAADAAEFASRQFKPALAELGAELVGETSPRSIGLAYPIRQVVENQRQVWREAFFGWLRFTSPAVITPEFMANWRQKPGVIRLLLVRLPRASVAVPRADTRGRSLDRSAPSENKPAPEAGETASKIDKEIDDLLAAVPN